MRRECDNQIQPIDTSLKFWFKGEQDRLVDEISGNSIVINSGLMEWNANKGAYLFKKPNNYNPQLCGYCLCDTGITQPNMTVVADIMVYQSGTSVIIVDTYPTRQAWFGLSTSWLSTTEWRRAAIIYSMSDQQRYIYVDGILKATYAFTYTTFNKYNGVALNFANRWANDFASWYGKNIRWYNRVLTLDEISTL